MHRPNPLLAAAAAVALAACAPDASVGPTQTTAVVRTADLAVNAAGATHLGFLSRNLYIGTNLDAVVGALASPAQTDDIPALLEAIGDIRATDWPARVVAIADEIERDRPHVIGLQEVWDVNVNLTPLGLAVTLDLDFLASLQAELAARGLGYDVVASFQGVTAAPIPGISVIDRDVILVDPSRVTVDPATAVSSAFLANVGQVAPGVVVQRGWVAVNAVVDGEAMRLVSTHLESGAGATFTTLRAYQAGQLMATLAPFPRALVLGDFNDVPGSPMHQAVVNAGFTDAWAAMRPGVVGYTCCHAEVLDNARAQDALDQRIDYIFARGLSAPSGGLAGSIRLTGVGAEDRLAGPQWTIWPSDHAGVSLRLLKPAAD